jgi:hypothetical protein
MKNGFQFWNSFFVIKVIKDFVEAILQSSIYIAMLIIFAKKDSTINSVVNESIIIHNNIR